MRKLLRSIYTFYSSHFFIGLLFSICCAVLFKKHSLPILITIFWFKAITMALVYYTVNQHKANEFYYYYNLSISKRLLWFITLGFDAIIYTSLLMVVYYNE